MRGDKTEASGDGEDNNHNNNNNSNNASTERKRYLKERVEKKEEQVLKIEAHVFQVANYYFVFQGVILTAVTKGALLMIADKYRESLNELDTRTRALYRNLYPRQIDDAIRDHQRKKARRNRILVLSNILFSIFAVINLVAAPLILCF